MRSRSPLDFTFVCPTEITAFSDRVADFEKLGAQVLGVSIDSQFTHLAWIQTDRKEGGLGDLKYPLVADLKKVRFWWRGWWAGRAQHGRQHDLAISCCLSSAVSRAPMGLFHLAELSLFLLAELHACM